VRLRVELVHQVDCLEKHLLVFDVDFCSNFEKPVDDCSSQLTSDLDLISQKCFELGLVLRLGHVFEQLPPVQPKVGCLVRGQERPLANVRVLWVVGLVRLRRCRLM